MKITNTFFKKRKARKWTWIAPNEKSKNEIDFCLINNLTVVKDYSVLSKFEFSSDHRVGRCSLQLPIKPKRLKYASIQKFRMNRVIIPEYKKHDANTYLCKKLEKWKIENQGLGIQEAYNLLVDSIENTLKKFGKIKTKENTNDKISLETKNLIEKREQ